MKETVRRVMNVADELLWSLRSIVRWKERRTTGHCTYSLVALEHVGIKPEGIYFCVNSEYSQINFTCI